MSLLYHKYTLYISKFTIEILYNWVFPIKKAPGGQILVFVFWMVGAASLGARGTASLIFSKIFDYKVDCPYKDKAYYNVC